MQVLQINELSADDTRAVEEYVDLVNAISAADAPWEHPATVTSVSGMIRRGWDGEPPRFFVARESGGRMVGSLEYWASDWDNTDLAWLWLGVHPDARRRGVGSDLVRHAVDRARADGRHKLGVEGWESERTAAFARAHGFAWASQAINRRQLLADVVLEDVQRLHDEASAHAVDYELLRVEGRTPDELMDQVAVMTAAINDAPLDDLDIEDEVFPPERIRAYEDAQVANGHRLYRLVARHRVTGELAGHTVVAVEVERPALGHQHDTSVLQQHRGHRLGLLLKTGMLLWLAEAEPQLESVDTWNTETNDFMIRVNEQLGYRVMGRGVQYQRRLD
jgi:GNAT superfamily N-acetyltransferase